MKNKLIITVLLFSFLSCQEQKVELLNFVSDVEAVEYITLDICVDDKGASKSVHVDPEKTTYENEQWIDRILELYDRVIYPEYKSNTCFGLTFQFVNENYEKISPSNIDCEKYDQFKTGEFKYDSKIYENTTISRSKDTQIKKNGDKETIYDIQWISPCEYTLTYRKVSEDKYSHLIGETIKVQIIDILSNESYVYRSSFHDKTCIDKTCSSITVIKKIK